MAKIKKIIIVLSLITIIIIMGIDIFFLSKFGAIKTFGTRYSSWIKSVAFSPDGTKIVSGDRDGIIKLWDVETGKLIKTFTGHYSNVESISISSDGKKIASGDIHSVLKLWDVETGKEIWSNEKHSGTILSIVFSTNDKQIISASDKSTVIYWDTETGREIKEIGGYFTDYPFATAFSPDNKKIITGKTRIKLWDVETCKLLRTFEKRSFYHSLAYSSDGTKIISGDRDGIIKLWNTETGKEIKTFTGHSGTIWSVVFSQDGTKIVSGSQDKTIKLWDIETGKEIKTFTGHFGLVSVVAFSPDGTKIVSGSGSQPYYEDGTIKLWNIDKLTKEGHYEGTWIFGKGFFLFGGTFILLGGVFILFIITFKKAIKKMIKLRKEQQKKHKKQKEEKQRKFKQTRDKFLKSDSYEYLRNFAKKYGDTGNIQLINNLQTLLAKKGFSFDSNEIRKLINTEIKKIEYENFKFKINFYNPSELDNYIKIFLEIYYDYYKDYVGFFKRLLSEKQIKFDEGNLINKIEKIKKELELDNFERQLTSNDFQKMSIEEVDYMTGFDFEHFLKTLFANMGYQVEHTKLSGDQGADLVISKFGEKIVVQAKRYANKVNNKAVQEVVAAINYYEANRGMVVTNSDFTKSAIDLAKANNIELINRETLERLIERYL